MGVVSPMSSPYSIRAFSIDLQPPGGSQGRSWVWGQRANLHGRLARRACTPGEPQSVSRSEWGCHVRRQAAASGAPGRCRLLRRWHVQAADALPSHLGEGTETSSVTMTMLLLLRTEAARPGAAGTAARRWRGATAAAGLGWPGALLAPETSEAAARGLLQRPGSARAHRTPF